MLYDLGEVFQVREVKVNCEKVQLICYCWHKCSVSPARIWHVSLGASNNICSQPPEVVMETKCGPAGSFC